jgi:hypothetical protein
MSESLQGKTTQNDEIDLMDLFRRFGKTLTRWSRAIGRAFLISFFFLLKRWLPLGLSIVFGVGVSLLLKITSESYYSSDLVLRTNPVSTSDMISYLNQLKIYCKEENKEALSQALSLKNEETKNIIDVGAFWIIDKYRDGVPDFVDYKNNINVSDTVLSRMQDRLDIRVITKFAQDYSKIKEGIIRYINSDSLFQRHNRVRLRQNQELLTRLNYDIVQLDSLQKFKYFEETKNRHPQNGGQMIFLQEQKTQLIYSDIYTLYARKQTLEADRELFKDIVTVLSDFTVTIKRINGGLFFGKKLIPIFFFTTLLVLILIANKNKLKEVYRKY